METVDDDDRLLSMLEDVDKYVSEYESLIAALSGGLISLAKSRIVAGTSYTPASDCRMDMTASCILNEVEDGTYEVVGGSTHAAMTLVSALPNNALRQSQRKFIAAAQHAAKLALICRRINRVCVAELKDEALGEFGPADSE
jgi:hypothetical protein